MEYVLEVGPTGLVNGLWKDGWLLRKKTRKEAGSREEKVGFGHLILSDSVKLAVRQVSIPWEG